MDLFIFERNPLCNNSNTKITSFVNRSFAHHVIYYVLYIYIKFIFLLFTIDRIQIIDTLCNEYLEGFISYK